jgi:hypothetical protein
VLLRIFSRLFNFPLLSAISKTGPCHNPVPTKRAVMSQKTRYDANTAECHDGADRGTSDKVYEELTHYKEGL